MSSCCSFLSRIRLSTPRTKAEVKYLRSSLNSGKVCSGGRGSLWNLGQNWTLMSYLEELDFRVCSPKMWSLQSY